MPKITVIIPVYNVENYLEKCVGSVEAQTCEDYKIILVDDGSTDKSGEICDRLAQKNERITVIHQENKGLGGARNTGILHCDTEYFLLLDSDDYIHPRLLEKATGAIEKQDCDIVVFDIVSVNENGDKGVSYSAPVPVNTLLSEEEKKILFKNPSACEKVYRTSLHRDNHILYPERVWYEDLITTPKILLFAEKVVKLESEPLYYYLQRSDSIMHTVDYARVVRERIAAVDDLIAFFRQAGKYEEYADILDFVVLYHSLLLPCLEFYRTSGSYRPFLEELLQHAERIVDKPLENRYIYLLRRNEKITLTLLLKRQFFAIKALASFNRCVKRIKHR